MTHIFVNSLDLSGKEGGFEGFLNSGRFFPLYHPTLGKGWFA